MNSYCPRCRAPIAPMQVACPQCGTPVAPGPQPPGFGQQAMPGMPPAGYGAPAPQPSHGWQGPPPGMPQPGYGAAPGYGPAPGYTPPAVLPPERGGLKKVLGGCGAAGCLGVLLACMAGMALIFLGAIAQSDDGGTRRSSSSRSRDSSSNGSSSDGSTSNGSSSDGSTSDGSSSPNEVTQGSLRDLVQSRIGVYTLVETIVITRIGEHLQGGITDTFGASYSAPDGSRLTEMLLAYRSREIVAQKMTVIYDDLRAACGPNNVTRDTVLNRSGRPIGTKIVCNEISTGREHVYWSNNNLLAIVSGPPPHPRRFQESTSY